MPIPAVLSAQMDPPPIAPVVEIDFVNEEYSIYTEPTTLNALLYNASGSFEDIIVENGVGLTGLHSDMSRTSQGIYPPSIRGTDELNARLLEIFAGGNLTAVCEFEFHGELVRSEDIPIFWIYRDSPFGTVGDGEYVNWLTYYQESTVPPGGFTEGYAYGGTEAPNEYQAGSPYEGSGDRRYRHAGTWCYDLGPGAGVNRYQGGQSVDGTPQGVDVSFGETPFSINHDLKYMTSIAASHFFGVGVDTSSQEGINDGWNWWPPRGFVVRYLAFYRGRPVSALPVISANVHTPIRVGQMYAEVVHNPINVSEIVMIPMTVKAVPLIPKMANVVVPTVTVNVVIPPFGTGGIG